MSDKKTSAQKEREFIDKVMKRLKRCVDADDHNRSAALDDLRFLNGDQWDQGEKNRRSLSNRPALQINLLPKFVDQVVGEMRHSRPSIKFRPVDNKADINLAKIREGIVRNIEYLSNAPAIYDTAAESQVSCGYGAWRVLTRYTEENPFIQEIYIESLRNPFLAYIDPDCKDSLNADAKYGFVLEKMPKADFEEQYPNFNLPSDSFKTGKGLGQEHWYDKESVTVAEYFELATEKIKVHQLEDGRVVTDEEYKELCESWDKLEDANVLKVMKMADAPQAQTPPGQAPQKGMPPGAPPTAPGPQGLSQPGASPQQPQGQAPPQTPLDPSNLPVPKLNKPRPVVEKSRETEKTIVKHWISTCTDIIEGKLEGDTFPGRYVPIVIIYGKERNIEGKRYIRGLIRDAKDPQKLVNYWNTTAAETIALAPKTPWLGTPKQFATFENDYANANTENFPFLQYNPDPDAPGPPARVPAAQPPVALFEQIRRGEENLKSVIGMFNSDVGAQGPEVTGAAITARQKPGDTSTLVFLENLARGVAHTGQIICEMIPEIYDTERDMRIRNNDDSESFVPVNTTTAEAWRRVEENPERYTGLDKKRIMTAMNKYGADAKFNELTVGKYDVVVTTGPSYATQRSESAEALLRLTSTMPEQMKLASDLIVRNLDFKDADEMADRLRKTLPPHLVKPREGEAPPMQPPIPPQVQIQQMKLQIEKGKMELQKMKTQQEGVKLEHEKIKLQIELAKAQQANAPQDTSPRINPLDVVDKRERMRLERDKLDLEHSKLEHQKEHDFEKIALERSKLSQPKGN
jgi:hypothetical protein